MIYSISSIWNKSLELAPVRAVEPRQHIYASELGGSFVDRYLKMTGVAPTNPPNARSLRKFEAGNIFEYLIGIVLRRAGILLSTQDHYVEQIPGLLKVTGRCDFVMGGRPDLEKAKSEIEQMQLPDMIGRASIAIIEGLKQIFGDVELPPRLLEVKSCSDFMFNHYDRIKQPNDNHVLQLRHYQRCSGYPGDIIYLNKDNMLMLEFAVNESADEAYIKDVTTMTRYLNAGEQPPKEPEVFFDETDCRFSKNWKVEYSNFLSMLYGYSTPEAYRERYDKLISSFNRTMKRCIKGDKMTKLNLDTIDEAKKLFPDWDSYVDMAKAKGITTEEEVEE